MSKLTEYWTLAVTWCKAHPKTAIAVGCVLAGIVVGVVVL